MTEECISRLAPIMRQLRQTRDRKQFLEQALNSSFFPDDCRPGYSEKLLQEMETENRLVQSVLAEFQAGPAAMPYRIPEVELPETGNERGLWTPFRYEQRPVLSETAINALAFGPCSWPVVKTNPGWSSLGLLIQKDTDV